MILVYSPGCWDLLHIGHVAFLERARALGDRLVVGVASDEVIVEDKGKPPVIPLAERVRMLQALRCVDVAVPYYEFEFMVNLRMFWPDILAVGETWGTDQRHLDAEDWVLAHGRRAVRIPYTRGVSTTEIREKMTR